MIFFRRQRYAAASALQEAAITPICRRRAEALSPARRCQRLLDFRR